MKRHRNVVLDAETEKQVWESEGVTKACLLLCSLHALLDMHFAKPREGRCRAPRLYVPAQWQRQQERRPFVGDFRLLHT